MPLAQQARGYRLRLVIRLAFFDSRPVPCWIAWSNALPLRLDLGPCLRCFAQEFDGSDSGARPDEAISWGKIRVDCKPVKVLSALSLRQHVSAAGGCCVS